MPEYIVLRRSSPMTRTAENMAGSIMASRASLGVETLSLEEVALTKTQHADLRRDPRTKAIAPPMPIRLIEPMDSDTDAAPAANKATWGVRAVRATDSPFTGAGITVAVLDTGIDPAHDAFRKVSLVRKNFTSEGGDDQNGHGTHCAGTLFGRDINNLRIGVAPKIKRALIGKVLDKRGEGGSSATLAKAILWAVNEGAHVISMSLGLDFPGYVDWLVKKKGWLIKPATSIALEVYRANINLFNALAESVQAMGAIQQGTVIVAASGNESNRPNYEIAVAPPAAGTGIIAVGALQEGPNGLSVAAFSNTQVDLSAPGVNVVSAKLGGGVTPKRGTSMATPHVAGVAALWAQKLREATGRVESGTLMAQLVASGDMGPLAPGAEEDDVGTGLVQAPLRP